MPEKTNGVSSKQLTIILAVVAILLGGPLTAINFWYVSGFERIGHKMELMDGKINRLTENFAEVRGALKAKGIVADQSEKSTLKELENEPTEPTYTLSPDSSVTLSYVYFAGQSRKPIYTLSPDSSVTLSYIYLADPCGWVDSHGLEVGWSFVEEPENPLFGSSLGFPVYSVFEK